ncbi:hypothetical protein Tco_0327656 [Tanacetum coccineum]
MSSSPSHATVTYTSMSSDDDVPSWGIPLMDAYESDPEAPEAVPRSPDQAPLSSAQDSVYSEYLAQSDDDLEPAEAQPLPHLYHLLLSHQITRRTLSRLRRILRRIPKRIPLRRRRSSQLLPIPHQLEYTLTYHRSWVAAPAPPLLPPSPLSPLSSLLPRISSPPLLLPPPTRKDIVPKADMPPRKRSRFADPSHRFKNVKSLAVAAARQPGSALARGTESGFVTTLKEVNDRIKIRVLQQQRQDNGDRWTRAIGCIQDLKRAREPKHHDGPPDAGSSC